MGHVKVRNKPQIPQMGRTAADCADSGSEKNRRGIGIILQASWVLHSGCLPFSSIVTRVRSLSGVCLPASCTQVGNFVAEDKHERVLREAVARGLVNPEGLRLLEKMLARYGPTLGALVGVGRLDAEIVQEIEAGLDRVEEAPVETKSPPAVPETLIESSPPPDPAMSNQWTGRRCGRYELEEMLGIGGMGEVYRAYDPELGRRVAVKILYSADPRLLSRFMQEARLQARVEHENVCRVYEVGEAHGRPYIAMQLINGRTLGDAYDEMTIEQRAGLVERIADAVHAAHRQGLIHRDIKPANIMVERSEEGYWKPYVTDFGLARDLATPGMTTTGQTVGTPAYMAPEQAYGERDAMDARTDVYGLGALLYHLTTRQPPFSGPTAVDIMMKVVQEDVAPVRRRNPAVAQDLETVILKCLEKDPDKRYPSARSVAEDLRRYLDGEPIRARRTTLLAQAIRKVSKHKAVVSVAGTAIALLLFVALGARWTANKQARIAQEFGREVQRIDSIMRTAYLLPLHDIRPDKARVRDSIRRIEGQARDLGPLALGPGEYALGRGSLALGEYQAARVHFEKARTAGESNADLAASLGLTLGFLYTRQLNLAARGEAREMRAEAIRKIQVELRDPAVTVLKSGRGSSLFPSPFVESVIAFCEERYEEALAGCQAALKRDPWFYEGLTLEGEIYLARANRRRDGGDTEGARAEYDQAATAFRAAARIGESDPRPFEGLCRLWTNVMQMGIEGQSGDVTSHMEEALRASESALAADASRSDAQLARSAVFWRWGQYQLRRGDDPTGSLSQAAAAARVAAGLEPDNAVPPYYLAVSRLFEAQYESSRGADPRQALADAIGGCTAALRIDPTFSRALSLLGVAYQDQATDQASRGMSPFDSLRESVAVLQRSVALSPHLASSRLNLGNAYLNLGQYERTGGKDPTPTLRAAIDAYAKAVSINPDMMIAGNNLAVAYEETGLYAESRGADPTADFDRAIAQLDETISAKPDIVIPRANLARVLRERAEYELLAGENPVESATRAIEQGDRALAMDPEDPSIYDEKAMALIVLARHDLSVRRSPIRNLREAERVLDKALLIDPDMSTAHQHLGTAATITAQWRLQQRRGTEESLGRAQ